MGLPRAQGYKFGVPGRAGFPWGYLKVTVQTCRVQPPCQEILRRNAKRQTFVNSRARNLRTHLSVLGLLRNFWNKILETFEGRLEVHSPRHGRRGGVPTLRLMGRLRTQRLHQVLN